MLALTLHVVVGELERRAQRRDDAFGDLGRVVHAVEVFAQHDELVAADARDRVGLADGGLQTGRRLDEQQVAGRVAERVVDRLEPVEVDVQARRTCGRGGARG